VPIGQKSISKKSTNLTRNLNKLLPPVHIHDFNQTPETVVKIMPLFLKSYALSMPKEVLQLIVTFSTPSFLRVNQHQEVVFKNCHGINVKLRGKGKSVVISDCSDLTLQIEDFISSLTVSSLHVLDSERLSITTFGKFGVHTYKLKNSSDVKVRFRDDSMQTVFTNRQPKGCI